jgi:putative endopeptidase
MRPTAANVRRSRRRPGLPTLAALCIAALFGVANGAQSRHSEPFIGPWGFDLSGMDASVSPGDDFFRYADGAWMSRTIIPPDKAAYTAADPLADQLQDRLRGVLEDASSGRGPVGPRRKIGAAYRAFMDEAGIEKRGMAPLRPDLAAIHRARSKAELAGLMGRGVRSYLPSLFDLSIGSDLKDPTRYRAYLAQGGLGLPDREYYLSAGLAAKKRAYEAYVAQILSLAGWPGARGYAGRIVAFETRIAEVSWTQAERRDPVKGYQPTTVAKLAAAAPGFAWLPFLASAGLGDRDLVLTTDTSLPKIAAVFADTPLPVLKAWAAFHTLDAAATVLPKRVVAAHFDFRDRTLDGQPAMKPRWRRGVDAVGDQLGDALGQAYVARYFPPPAKAKIDAIVGDLRAAFTARIGSLEWMSPQTRREALAKLAALDVQVGYPTAWRDYRPLRIAADDAYGNGERAIAFDWARQIARLDRPVDRNEWDAPPQVFNAYNRLAFNQIVFPAALLQAPLFDAAADPAINYGAIGAVIGHEMTHGFDDQGRKFDAQGKLRDWWAAADAARFEARAKALAAQYSAIEPLPGAHIQGDLTVGENIADLGGLALALEAYHISLHGRPAPVIDGFSGDQRVFLGWAQIWRQKLRDDLLRQQIASDTHSPAEARVDGAARNLDAWYVAFDVKRANRLYLAPDDRVRIW